MALISLSSLISCARFRFMVFSTCLIIESWVINSVAEPLEYSRNFIKSLSVPLSKPSAILLGIEIEEATIYSDCRYGLTSSIIFIIFTATSKLRL